MHRPCLTPDYMDPQLTPMDDAPHPTIGRQGQTMHRRRRPAPASNPDNTRLRSNKMHVHLRPQLPPGSYLLVGFLLLQAAAAQAQPTPPSLLSKLANGAPTAAASQSSPSTPSSPVPAPQLPLPARGATRDAWATDPTLQAAQRLLDGDHLNLLSELVLSKDLDAIWSEPWAAHGLLRANPVLQLVPGLGALADKAPEDFTAEDGRAALGAFRGFVRRALENMGKRMDPGDMAADLEAYATRGERDPVWGVLMDAAEAGDGEAAGALHDVVFDELWGGVVDKEKLGLGPGGKAVREAEATARLREHVREEEPALWKLITQEDPFITQCVFVVLGTWI